MRTNDWDVHLYFEEDDDNTHATAVLRTRDGESLRAQGSAKRNPSDPPVPEVGEELAAARALHGLVNQLTDAAMTDIAALVRQG